MEGISDIRVVGIDEKRYPRIRKAPYIDLFFKLSHQAPKEWCDYFNDLGKRLDPPVKIDKSDGLFIEAWVRDMDLIPACLDKIKQAVEASNAKYMETVRQLRMASGEDALRSGEDTRQGRLNAILASLNFDD